VILWGNEENFQIKLSVMFLYAFPNGFSIIIKKVVPIWNGFFYRLTPVSRSQMTKCMGRPSSARVA